MKKNETNSDHTILLPPTIIQLLENITKLTPLNYYLWSSQLSLVLTSHGYMPFLDGSSSPPLPMLTTGVNPAFINWHVTDACLTTLIKSTLSGEAMAKITRCISARHVWTTLESAFGNNQLKDGGLTGRNNVYSPYSAHNSFSTPAPSGCGGNNNNGGVINTGNNNGYHNLGSCSNTNNSQNVNENEPQPTNNGNGLQGKLDEFELELSKIVGLVDLKFQLRKWSKGMLMDEKRRAMGIDLGSRKMPHMVFLGNPGTGKTTIARILGKLLCDVGLLWKDKVIEVQRSDLVGTHIGQTAIKTKAKIKEAKGGVLFVDEAYRLAIAEGATRDFGVEALEEIMSVLEDGEIVVILAGYTEPMKRVFSSNEGFTRRMTHFFEFEDYSCQDLAEMLMIKMNKQNKKSRLYGFRLHSSCTLEAVCALIESNSTKKLRNKLNGGLVDHVLNNARENLDFRLNFESKGDELVTITLQDLEAGVQVLTEQVQVD